MKAGEELRWVRGILNLNTENKVRISKKIFAVLSAGGLAITLVDLFAKGPVFRYINNQDFMPDISLVVFGVSTVCFFGGYVYSHLLSERLMHKDEIEKKMAEMNETELRLMSQSEEMKKDMSILTRNEKRYRAIFETSDEGLWFIDTINNEMTFSAKWMEIFGVPEDVDKISLEMCFERIHPEEYDMFKKLINDLQSGDLDRFAVEIRIMNSEGDYRWVSAKAISVNDEEENVKMIAGSYSDIHERKTQEQKVIRIAYYDNVTMLPNRVFMYEWLQKRIVVPSDFAVMFVDIDNFKIINDNFGHIVGDMVLNEVGARITMAGGIEKMVARMSGDEFLIIVDRMVDPNVIQEIAKSIVEALRTSIKIEENELHISASVGISIFPKDANSVDELLRSADTALSRAKELGKNCYILFDKSMNEEVRHKIEMGNALRYAVENGELTVYYQPQVSVETGKMYGLEALVRWNSPKYGFVSPIKFIRLAEELGMIVNIGDFVFKQSCTYAEKINRDRDNKLIISINISSIQLMQSDFVEKVEKIVEETGVDPKYIGIEITETALMESFDTSAAKLEILKEKGMEIALDDFGTGYSSLNYLRKLPITKLKIDKSFVDDLLFDERGVNLAESIIQIAHKFGMGVVAEGVENEEQLGILIKGECDIIQGYLISKPLPEQQLEAIMDIEYRFETVDGEFVY